MSIYELDLENPYSSHGQLYVAYMRIGKSSSLFVYTPQELTKNIIYQIALR